MQIATRLTQAAPPGVRLERSEPGTLPEPDAPEIYEKSEGLSGWAKAGLVGIGLTSVAAGFLGSRLVQPNPLNACAQPEVRLEQQVGETRYDLELAGNSLCVDAPGKAGDYSVTFEDGSYQVRTRTFSAEVKSSDANYKVPSDEHTELVGADESSRWQFAGKQEDAIRDAFAQHREELNGMTLETGVVTFPNSQSPAEPLMANRLTVDGQRFYTLNDGHGNGFTLYSEVPWSDAESQDALARVADYSSTVPDHLATGVTSIEFKAGGKPGADWAAATYYDKDRIVFWNGTNNLSERVLVHELGHAIGFDAQRGLLALVRGNQGVPKGWEDAMEADGHALSEYSHNSKREDFAESWLGYLDARQANSLDEFREAYPERTVILDQLFTA